MAEEVVHRTVGDRHEVGPAVFSEDRVYRYTLERVWDPALRKLMVIGLNPSTADENALDPTLRRIRAFAKRGPEDRPDVDLDADPYFGGFVMTNLFAYRATDPKDMKRAVKQGIDVVGPDNDDWLLRAAREHIAVLAAWGVDGGFLDRDQRVHELLTGAGAYLVSLGTTNKGFPRHPLYVKGDTPMRAYLQRIVS